MSIHCHASKRQKECVSSNHQIHGQRHTPQCVISILCIFAKSAKNRPICWVLWGLKGMHPDMQVMSQACQLTAMHPQAKQSKPIAIISSVNSGTHHDALFLPSAFCQTCSKPASLLRVLGGLRGMHADMQLMPQCLAPTFQMEHARTNHQLHGQRHNPRCVISILCIIARSTQNWPICWVLWGLKGTHSDMQVMTQACQSIPMHPKDK